MTVQSAIDLYMADAGLDVLPDGDVESTGTGQFGTGSTLALYPAYLRQNPTRCQYTWSSDGVVSQVADSCG